MSSNAYFAELRPDPALRLSVQWISGAIGLVGLVVILGLAVPLALRLAGAALWIAVIAGQLIVLRRGWASCVALRVFADGSVKVLGPDGSWTSGRLEPDGVLLRRWGWIRLRADSGRSFAEPLRGSCRGSREWRRLQVAWRHIGA